MTSKKILLSISILISNRPDTVEKCLKSLDTLYRKVPSELILVDTGCGDAARRIIEHYADKIVEFEWCNDFSKARNAGLRQAEGEWFLYLDDDEWFENTKAIEEFFLSGKYLQYNFGYYVVRNYRDLEGREYGDDYVGRMIRLFPDVEFMFSVHECFSNVRMPAIRLNSYVHHYGYVFENEEVLRRHGRRNVELLLVEHEKDPSELHHILQLAQEYNALKEWEKVIEISRKGIQAAVPGPKGDYYRGGFYGAIVRAFFTLGQYEQTVEVGEKYLGMEELNELAIACVSYFLCIAYLEMGDAAKSLEAVQRYREIYTKWTEDQTPFLKYENLLTNGTYAEESVRQVLYRGVCCGIRLGEPVLAKSFFDDIIWDTQRSAVDVAIVDLIQDLVEVWLQTETDLAKEYTAMMKTLLRDSALARVIEMDLHLLQEKSPELLQTKKADWAALADKNWIFLYFKLKNVPEAERELLLEDYCKLWKEPKECLMRAKELRLWEMAKRDDMQMGQVLSCIPIYHWKQAAEAVIEELSWQDVQELQDRMQDLLDADSFHMMYWSVPYRRRRIYVMTEGGKIQKDDNNALTDDVVEALMGYATEVQKLYRKLYREELFQESPGLLPRECQLSLKLLEMNSTVKEGNLQRALSVVREAVELMPELSEALKCCASWLSEKSAAQNEEQEKARNEMRRLAEAVKAQVRNMIAQGMISEAAGVVCQLKAMLPGDGEVAQMEKEIRRRQPGTE